MLRGFLFVMFAAAAGCALAMLLAVLGLYLIGKVMGA
jgi:hypothetical protein